MNILDPEDEEEHTQEEDSSGSNEDEDDSQDEEEEEEEDEEDDQVRGDCVWVVSDDLFMGTQRWRKPTVWVASLSTSLPHVQMWP